MIGALIIIWFACSGITSWIIIGEDHPYTKQFIIILAGPFSLMYYSFFGFIHSITTIKKEIKEGTWWKK